MNRPPCRCQPAGAAADECPQQILVRRVVAAGEALVACQLRLHEVELLLRDDGWDRCDKDPFVARDRRMPVVGASDRLCGRAPNRGRLWALTTHVDEAGICRIRQHPANARDVPAREPASGYDPLSLQSSRDAVERRLIFAIPSEHLPKNCRLGFVNAHA